MQLPLQITFHNMNQSDAIAGKVRECAAKLDKYFDGIVSCHVVIEMPHHHHGVGNQFRVRVEVAVPGEKLVANRKPDAHHAYTDVYIAIRDAFDAMRRQLEDYSARTAGEHRARRRQAPLTSASTESHLTHTTRVVVCVQALARVEDVSTMV